MANRINDLVVDSTGRRSDKGSKQKRRITRTMTSRASKYRWPQLFCHQAYAPPNAWIFRVREGQIIKLVEQSHLPAKRTLDEFGIPRATFGEALTGLTARARNRAGRDVTLDEAKQHARSVGALGSVPGSVPSG